MPIRSFSGSVMSTNETTLQNALQQVITDAPNTLRAAVATEALDCGYENEQFFSDLLQHGCQSWMMGTLVYYRDTHQFYDTHYDEIEELREELEDAFGGPLHPKGDLKNWFAWMAFEETARAITYELEL